MMRSAWLLLTGAIAGGVAVYFLVGRMSPPSSASLSRTESQGLLPVAAPQANPGQGPVGAADAAGTAIATRIAAFERAMQATDALDLESMIEFAALAPRSRARDLELNALLDRLSEIDPNRAVSFAQSAFLETPQLIQAFRALARADVDAAIMALAEVSSPRQQRRVALALLAVTGTDERVIERIAAGLPAERRAGFELDAMIERARSDPMRVLQELLAENRTGVMAVVLPQITRLAMAQDPSAAIALFESVPGFNLRRNYLSVALREWAELDSEAVFVFLESGDPAMISASTAVFGSLANSDPDRVLAMVDDLPPAARSSAKRAVIRTLAERDPMVALALLETMAPGQDRASMLQTIAQAYGRDDPELAFAWAKSLSPPSEQAVQSVLQGIAAVDVDRAIDLFIDELENRNPVSQGVLPPSFQSSLSFSMLLSVMSSNGADVGRLADRLLELGDPTMQSMLGSAVSRWAASDSEAAQAWTLNNAARLDGSLLRTVARQMGDDNPALAMSMLDRLVPEQRAGWFEGLASAMARTDINQATSLLDRYRGQPGHDAAVAVVARELARVDPERAARMLADTPASREMNSASFTIAREWANLDPVAASRWALELSDSDVRSSTINSIASTWAQRDADAAERWLFDLPNGADRDAAANGFMTAAAQVGRFDPNLLDAYSSSEARQQGVSRAVMLIGRTDREQAERLIAEHLTDPALRAQAEEQLARAGAASRNVIISNGQAILLQ